eukprot:gene11573-56377_t
MEKASSSHNLGPAPRRGRAREGRWRGRLQAAPAAGCVGWAARRGGGAGG